MQRLKLSFALTISLSLLLLVLGAPLRPQRAAARWVAQPHSVSANGGTTTTLSAALNPDGTLKATAGSFDATGYQMELAANGAPRFVTKAASAPRAVNCWDTQFALSNGTSGKVQAVAVLGTDVYVGGDFLAAGNVAANRVAKYSTVTNTWSALGSGGGNGVNNTVNALAVIGSSVYVGGSFTRANVGGTPMMVNRVAKYDTSTNTWSALGSDAGNGVSDTVRALAVMGNDLYVGGAFASANWGGPPADASSVAKYNTSTNTWSALGANGRNGVNGIVSALAVMGSDLYVGGNFTSVYVSDIAVAMKNVARYDSNSNTWSALGSDGGNGVNDWVTALAVLGSDLYVGGGFTIVNMGSTPVAANRVAKYSTSTHTWFALDANGGNGVNNTILTLLMVGSDLYVGGRFTSVGNMEANYVARYNTNTNTWSTLGAGSGNGVDRVVLKLAMMGNDLYVGGEFTVANLGDATVAVNRVAKYSTNTNTWNALDASGGNGVNDTILTLLVIGSDIYVGGKFTSVGNVVANRVAKYNTSTHLWSALGSGNGNGVNDWVTALAVMGSDLYVGGSFTSANIGGSIVAANRVAKYNLSTNTWTALGSGGGNGVDNSVSALAVIGRDLYLGGYFTSANLGGSPVAANNVAKYSTNTNTWSALGSGGGNGVNNSVSALAVMGSDLYVGGAFFLANLGDTAITANRVAKYDTRSNSWSGLVSGSGNNIRGGVSALAVSGSDLYLGGFFGAADIGATVTVYNVAKYSTSSNTWSALGSGGSNGVNNFVFALAVSGSDVYVGGLFTSANLINGTVTTNRVAKYSTDTNTWSALGSGDGNGLNNDVIALAVLGRDLYVGGQFNSAGGNVSANLARFLGDVTPTAPTIRAATGITRQQGSLASNASIATVSDVEDAADTLTVTVNGAASTNVNGVTITNLAINAAGNVTADIRADCGATTATFELHVADCCGHAAVAPLTVTVTANTAPTLAYAAASVPASGATTVTRLLASDNGLITGYTLASINPPLRTVPTVDASGAVSITNASPAGDHVITVRTMDNCGATTEASFTLTVTCPTITVSPATPTLSAGRAGTPYSQTFIPSGANGAVNFTISAGSLPAGLTLASNGLLEGTPSVFGSFNFTVRATDVNSCFGERAYTLTLNPPCTTISLSPASLANGFVGTVYNQMLTATGGGAPYSFAVTSGSLPGGLTLASGGALTGTPTVMGLFNFTVTATDNTGCTGSQAYSVVVSGNGLQYFPLPAPVRLYDTRTPIAGFTPCAYLSAPVPANGELNRSVVGTCTGIPASAQAVTGTATAIAPNNAGFATLYPAGQTRPPVSTLNFVSGQIVSNNFTVGLDAQGEFRLFTTAEANFTVDLTGYFAPPASGGLYYHPLPKPLRLYDTRAPIAGFAPCAYLSQPVAADGELIHSAFLTCDGVTIPTSALAITGNVSALAPSGGGFVTLYPDGQPRPSVANLNYLPGQVVTNAFTTSLDAQGEFRLYSLAASHYAVDITGYYSTQVSDVNGAGLLYTSLAAPLRLYDTRAPIPGFAACEYLNAPLAANGELAKTAHLTCQGLTIPTTAQALTGSAIAITPTGVGFATLYPDGQTRLPLSNLNYLAGEVVTNAFTISLSDLGVFRLYTFAQAHFVVDVAGYYAP